MMFVSTCENVCHSLLAACNERFVSMRDFDYTLRKAVQLKSSSIFSFSIFLIFSNSRKIKFMFQFYFLMKFDFLFRCRLRGGEIVY